MGFKDGRPVPSSGPVVAGFGLEKVANAEIALVHGTGGTLGAAHSGATLLLSRD